MRNLSSYQRFHVEKTHVQKKVWKLMKTGSHTHGSEMVLESNKTYGFHSWYDEILALYHFRGSGPNIEIHARRGRKSVEMDENL